MIGKITKKEQKILDFLEERNLTPTFKRFQKLKKVRKRHLKIEIDGVPQRLLVYKNKKTTFILDAFTLKNLATTTKYTPKNIEKGFELKEIKNKKFSILKRDINLKNVNTTVLTNNIQIERSRPIKTKMGKLFLNVTFFGKGHQQTSEGGSRKVKNLGIPSEKKIAFDEAFKGALSYIDFSYETYRINWIHYTYYYKKGVVSGAI